MSDESMIDVTDLIQNDDSDNELDEGVTDDSRDRSNKENEESKQETSRSNYFNKQQFDRLKDVLQKKKDNWLNAEGFQDFLQGSIFGIAILTVYFYFGINFNLLAKNAQSNPNGLEGQDINGPPYSGNFTECSENKINLTQPLSEWSFPYKNPITCNADAYKNKPLYFRFVTWTLGVVAFSYSIGRTILNLFLSSTNETANVLLGPILMIVLLSSTFFVGWSTSLVGVFANVDKLLPSCYFTLWFPIITTLLFVLGFYIYPTNIALLQFFTMLYFLFFYASVSSLKIVENGVEKTTKGIVSILSRILTNSSYLLFVLIIVAINALKYLGIVFATPILGWIGFYVVTRYISFLMT